MEDSIFTKIIKGEIPCHKIYEDDRVFAFLDINPMTEGHTLLVPKQQIGSVWDVEDELYQYLFATARKIAQHLQSVLEPKRVGLQIEGFGVPDHAHLHIVPLWQGLDKTTMEYIERQPVEPDHAALAEIAKRLSF